MAYSHSVTCPVLHHSSAQNVMQLWHDAGDVTVPFKFQMCQTPNMKQGYKHYPLHFPQKSTQKSHISGTKACPDMDRKEKYERRSVEEWGQSCLGIVWCTLVECQYALWRSGDPLRIVLHLTAETIYKTKYQNVPLMHQNDFID